MTVLVTGAGGFIASHIVKQLQEQGYKVRGTLRSLEDEDKVKRLTGLCPQAVHKLELVAADLKNAESWQPAVKDITYVIHVASPFPSQQPKDENEVIVPAVEGTKAILKACIQAKSVKKVVMTSSSVAVHYGQGEANRVYNEEDWMTPEALNAYGKSKLMAEKAAWEYVRELRDEDKIELIVINPAYVMGPVIHGSQCVSTEIIKNLLERKMRGLPKLNLALVDVRDVAAAHIKAMTTQEVSGRRFLIVNENLWLKEIAQILASEFRSKGYNIPTSNYSNIMLRLVGLLNKHIKAVIPQCGKVTKFDNTKMKEILGVTPQETKDTLIDMAYSMIEDGFIKKTKKYIAREDQLSEPVKKEGEEEKTKSEETGETKKEPKDEQKEEEKDGEEVKTKAKGEGAEEGHKEEVEKTGEEDRMKENGEKKEETKSEETGETKKETKDKQKEEEKDGEEVKTNAKGEGTEGGQEGEKQEEKGEIA